LRRIAVDETKHAAFAWEILRWGMARVSPEDRRRVERALRGALVGLQNRDSAPMDPGVRALVGHPGVEQERDLARQLVRLVQNLRDGVTISANAARGAGRQGRNARET
jgi:hypothetical protein